MADVNNALTPQEVADILKITKNTVYEMIKRGELNAFRIGRKIRIDKEDLDTYKSMRRGERPEQPQGILIREDNNHRYQQPIPQQEPTGNNDFVICGQDVILDILSRHLEAHPKGIKSLRSYVGSYKGLFDLYHGKVQLTATHLWAGDTNTYNVPYVQRMLPGMPAIIIHLACRMQGFYIKRGNPKKISGWEDLKRRDLTYINREKGSGTRVLLDEKLKLLGITGETIKGYNHEYLSHLSIASAVARGEGDYGLGNEKTSLQVQGIEFLPLQKESYDMVLRKSDMSKPECQTVLEILRGEAFKKELLGIGGYDLTNLGVVTAEV